MNSKDPTPDAGSLSKSKAPMGSLSRFLTLHPQNCRVEIEGVQIGVLEQVEGLWKFTPLGWFAAVPGNWVSLDEARKALLLSSPIQSFRQMKKPAPQEPQEGPSTFRPGLVIGNRTILKHWKGPKGYLVCTRCVCGREQTLTARSLQRHPSCGCQGKSSGKIEEPRKEEAPNVLVVVPRQNAVEMLTVQEKNALLSLARQELKRPVYETKFDELPANARLRRGIQLLGIRVVLDVMRYTPQQLLRLPNLGRTSVQELRATLAGIGVKWPNLHAAEVLATDTEEIP